MLVTVKVVGLILIVDPAASQAANLPKSMFSRATEALLAAFIGLAFYQYGSSILPRTRLHILPVTFVAVAAISTALAENQYVATFGEIERYLGLTFLLDMLVLYAAVAVAFSSDRDWLILFSGVALAAGASIAYGLVQRAGLDPIRWVADDPSRPFSTFGNPDPYGNFLSVTYGLGLAVVALADRRLRWIRLAAAALAVASFAFIAVVATRSALIGVLASTLVVLVIFLRHLRRASLRRALLVMTVGAAALGLMYAATPLGDRVRTTIAGVNVRDRVLLYEAATRATVERPLFGAGPDSFSVVYPRYRQAEANAVSLPGQGQTSAHSWVFNTAATLGLAGLAMLAISIVAFGVALWSALPLAPLIAGSALAAVLAYWGSGLVAVGSVAVDWVGWVGFGVAAALARREAIRADPVRDLPPLAIASALTIALVIASTGITAIGASRSSFIAKAAIARDDGMLAVSAARAAVGADPGRADHWARLGRAFAVGQHWSDAAGAFAEAAKRAPYLSTHWENLARALSLLATTGDQSRGGAVTALDAARTAARADANNPNPYATLGEVAARVGAYDEALDGYAQAIQLYPRSSAWDQAFADVTRHVSPARARDALLIVVRSRDVVALRLALAQVYALLNDADAAAENVHRALVLDPSDQQALRLWSQLSASGNLALNGGPAEDLAFWTTQGSWSFGRDSTSPTGGAILGAPAGSSSFAYQDVPIVPGAIYSVAAWIRGDGQHGGSLLVQWLKGAGTIGAVVSPTATAATWTEEVIVGAVPPPGATTLRLQLQGSAGPVAYAGVRLVRGISVPSWAQR